MKRIWLEVALLERLNDRNIFLLDGIGASLSALSTGLLLPLFSEWTGVPTSVSQPLAILGMAFAVFSLGCFWLAGHGRHRLLLALILANLTYCLLAIAVALALKEITPWGVAYFFGEVAIIGAVIFLEASVYRHSIA